VTEAYGRLPLHFEANEGQAGGDVKFLARGRGYTILLNSTEAVLLLKKPEPRPERRNSITAKAKMAARPDRGAAPTASVIRMHLVGANAGSGVAGHEPLPGKVNYFIGNDPAKWRTNVPTYAQVQYTDVYPGIDLVYYGNQRQLEYDFVVRPGADHRQIMLGFEGADRLEVDAQGDLVLYTAAGDIRQRKPVIYQDVEGVRKAIAGGYVLTDRHLVSFRVASYDANRPLVIDPVLSYSTYLGGSGQDEAARIAVDAAGHAYVTGFAESANLPTTLGAFQTTSGGATDAFVTKLNPAGSGLVYSTYLGGSSFEEGSGIAVDAAGNAYVTGSTYSADFPTTPGSYQPTLAGDQDAFMTKLNSTGSGLLYSTYLGGSGPDVGRGIVVDTAGSAYVTGDTSSTDFPTTPGAFQPAFDGLQDAFVIKLNPSGSALAYSTYLGGSDGESSGLIAVDTAGSAYVTGTTRSADFPTTPGAFQPAFGGVQDAFVIKLTPSGSALVYSTYLGGSGTEVGWGIAVDAAGNAYVTGATGSTNFPTTSGAFQSTLAGVENAYVTKVAPTGSALLYSTYLGGSSGESSYSIAVDMAGNAYVTGGTGSSDFPTTSGAFQTTLRGDQDVFVTKLDSTGSALVYSTYLGGSGGDNEGHGIAVDAAPNPNAYVVGVTSSPSFPTTMAALQTAFGGGVSDAFVVKIGPFNTPAGSSVSVAAGNDVTVTFADVVSPGDTGATTSGTGPTPPAGFSLGTPPTYYDITTTATFAAPVSVCITYDPMQFGDPSTLRLFHFENDAWVDVTTSNDTGMHIICGEVSSFSVFAIAQPGSSLTSLGPARIWVGLKNSDDVGIRFDLRAEAHRNGTQLVGSGELASVAGGSSGFNNAKLNTITLTPVGGAAFQSGDTVSIRLYVRNACTGSGKNSGGARLWFNDSAANSRFDVTIGSPATYFLRDGFSLATAPGPGPKKTVDVAAGAKCGPYKTFGTWSMTLP
jgi:hypothetical protein